MFLKQLPLSTVWQLARHMYHPRAVHTHSRLRCAFPLGLPSSLLLLETSSHPSPGPFRGNIICPALGVWIMAYVRHGLSHSLFFNGSVSSVYRD